MITKSFLMCPSLANKVMTRITEENLPMHFQRGINFPTESGNVLCKVTIDLEECDLDLLNCLIESEEMDFGKLKDSYNLNMFRDQVYKIACNHGFHEQHLSDDHFLCLVVSELMEAVEAYRKGKRADIIAFNTRQCVGRGSKDVTISYEYNFGLCIKDTVEDELADACIRLLDLAGLRSINTFFSKQIAAEISPQKSFTENILTITRFISGVPVRDHEDLLLRINHGLAMIFTLAMDLNIDINKHIQLKMEYNASRPYKHGKLF